MKRKIVKQGAATLMISLPATWARENNLEKGGEVSIEEQKNNLIISPDDLNQSKKSIEINLESNTESSIRTIITTTYRLGYDEIKINFQGIEAIKIISDIVNNTLIGFEIINKTQNSCVIENITEPSQDSFDNIFNKVLLNIDELLELSKDAINNKKIDFIHTSKKIQQFDNFCRRVLSKNKNIEESKLLWHFHSSILHASRDLTHLLKYLSKNKTKQDEVAINLLNESKNIFEILKGAYLEKSIKNIEIIHDIYNNTIEKKSQDFFKKSNDPVIVHHLLNSIRNFYLASSPLTGLIIK
ncbi:phosphate uptake regulator PhoU [Candidatus Pacearchaeota archaeon]|nr:phosphate uptake regulator PhoU [Candidatus Pacearchaeota archaeon]